MFYDLCPTDLNTKRNQKNQDVIWKQVSGQDTSSQFISRLVTRRKEKQHTFTENQMNKKTAHMGTEIFMHKLMCDISVQWPTLSNKYEYAGMQ